MVIAAAWLFLHPKQYGLHFPRVQTRPALLELEKPASIYELTICLGNGRTRDGYMRALRNLNPRYRADSWLPAGTTIRATTRITGLYKRYCRSEEHTSELQSLMRISYAVFCLKKKTRESKPLNRKIQEVRY